MFDLFTNATLNDNQVPFLIACNKHDMITAKSQSSIKNQLEKEMYVLIWICLNCLSDQLRMTRTATPGQEDNEEIFIGTKGKPFTMDQLTNSVEFCECSGQKPSLVPVIDFMLKHITS